MLIPNLWQHAVIVINSPQMLVPFVNITMPRMVAYLIGNVVTQYPFLLLFLQQLTNEIPNEVQCIDLNQSA